MRARIAVACLIAACAARAEERVGDWRTDQWRNPATGQRFAGAWMENADGYRVGAFCVGERPMIGVTIPKLEAPSGHPVGIVLRIDDEPPGKALYSYNPLATSAVAWLTRATYARMASARAFSVSIWPENGEMRRARFAGQGAAEAMAVVYAACPVETALDAPPRPAPDEIFTAQDFEEMKKAPAK